ncbi:MAG: tryptophan synthase subunit alpha [Chloroflexota bacterium]|nr:tryptophan synthase subunit alpha [Chloroflexota bacterium]
MTAAETYALAPTETGSQRTAAAFAKARAEGRPAVIPFVTAGYPTPEISEDVALAIVRGGADLLEIGVPFSDPLADGTTVQRTSQIALTHGITLRKSLEMAKRLRDQGVEIPLILMGYVNPMLAYGIEQLAADSAAHGVDGYIVPDLPAEEAAEIATALRAHGVDLIFLVAPTSTDERIAEVARIGSGWVYCVSTTGVTGERASLPDLKPYIDRVRGHTNLPIAVGFGVSNPEHVAQIGEIADGAVIASAMINFLDTAPVAEQAQVAERYVRGLRGEEEFPPVVSASEQVASAAAPGEKAQKVTSPSLAIACRGVRGATTIEANTAEEILEATTDLLEALIRLNDIQPEDVVSAVFTTTPELTAAFPALAARKLGWTEVPLLCAHEMAVPGALQGVIRILLHINSPRSAAEIRHIYLRDARALRPEWALTDAELAEALGRPVPA